MELKEIKEKIIGQISIAWTEAGCNPSHDSLYEEVEKIIKNNLAEDLKKECKCPLPCQYVGNKGKCCYHKNKANL